MDTVAERLSSYSAALRYPDLPDDVIRQAKRLIVDTFGCALGGYAGEPSKIARDLAATVTGVPPATIIGSCQNTSPDLAAFANGIMVRCLDYNDGYSNKGSGHPSDNIPAILAASQLAGAGGKRVIVATVLAYETFCRFCDAVDIRPNGFDHVAIGCIAATLGVAHTLRLSQNQTVQALNLGIAPNLGLYQTRTGNLSMWSSCAYANAGRNAVFAAMLASRGMTGPSPIFEGPGGFFKAVSHGPFELEPFGGNGRQFKILECSIKRFPLSLYLQTLVQAMLELREQLPDLNLLDVAELNIQTTQTAARVMAGNPEKWRPTSPETAAQSMPYTAALALTYGPVERRHFSEEYLNNQQLLGLTQKVKVTVSEEANRRAAESTQCVVELVTRSSQRYSVMVQYPKGHFKNPMSDSDIEQKFRSLSSTVLGPSQTADLLDRLWHIDDVEDILEVLRLTRINSGSEAL